MAELLSETVVRQALERAKMAADTDRRAEAETLLDYYHMDLDADFALVLQQVFRKPEEKIPVMINPLRKFAHTLATVFQEDPVVQIFAGGEEPSDPDQELWDWLADRGQWYEALRDANRLEHVVGTLHLLPRTVNGYIDLALVTPDITAVHQRADAPHRADAVLYQAFTLVDSPHAAVAEDWVVWTAEEHYQFTQGGTRIEPVEGNDDMVNPYGVIPLLKIDVRRPRIGWYWNIGAVDMLSVTRAVCAVLTSMGHGGIVSGFTQMAATNFPREQLKTIGPDSIISVENVKEGDIAPKLESVQLDADIEAQREGVEYIMQQAAILQGVPASEFRITGAPESGIARWLDRLPLTERRQQDVVKWRRDLRGLFELISTVWATDLESDPDFASMVPDEFRRPFSPAAELRVDFPEPKFPESELEKLERWEREIQLGIKSPVDVLMERNPDFNREQAQQELIRIAQETQEYKGASILAQLGISPEGPQPNREQ